MLQREKEEAPTRIFVCHQKKKHERTEKEKMEI